MTIVERSVSGQSAVMTDQFLSRTQLCVGPHAQPGSTLPLQAVRHLHFLSGRDCAAQALRLLGAESDVVGRSEKGVPLWPTDVCGSIAHDQHRAVAVVARREHWLALGVDVEPDAPLPEDAASIALTPAERVALHRINPQQPLRDGRLLFAAKECVHKAVNPLNGAWLEFDEVRIDFDDPRQAQGGWVPVPLSDAAHHALQGLHTTGRWWRDDSGWLVVLGLSRR